MELGTGPFSPVDPRKGPLGESKGAINRPQGSKGASTVARMKALAKRLAAPDFLAEMDGYARDAAPSYLENRKEYVTPEEAAETDVSYWESEE